MRYRIDSPVMTPPTSPRQLRGTVHGRTIALDEDLSVDGARVVVTVVFDEPPDTMTPDQHQAAWDEWVARGEQGPISEDDDRGFP